MSDVDISVAGDSLVLKGSRPGADATTEAPTDATTDATSGATGERPVGEKVVWLLQERGTGAFERRITLPVAVDSQRVEARLVDGVLTVVCPKLAACQPRKVEVRSA